MLLNIMTLSPDLSQNVLRVKFMKSIELKTKFVMSVALGALFTRKSKTKKQI